MRSVAKLFILGPAILLCLVLTAVAISVGIIGERAARLLA
jgi:hypothetical protein